MSTTTRFLAPALLALAALAATGCGGGGYGGFGGAASGSLEIQNDPFSSEGIDAIEVSVPYGPVDHYDLFLAPGENDFVDLYPDAYDVDVLWSDGSVDTYHDVEIEDGLTTTLTGWN